MSPAARGPACPPFRPAADEGGVWRCRLRSAKNRPRLPAAGFLTFVLANGRAGPRPSVPWGPRAVRPDAERRPSRPCLFGEQSHRLSVTASRSRGAPSRMTKAQQSGESLPPEGHLPRSGQWARREVGSPAGVRRLPAQAQSTDPSPTPRPAPPPPWAPSSGAGSVLRAQPGDTQGQRPTCRAATFTCEPCPAPCLSRLPLPMFLSAARQVRYLG